VPAVFFDGERLQMNCTRKATALAATLLLAAPALLPQQNPPPPPPPPQGTQQGSQQAAQQGGTVVVRSALVVVPVTVKDAAGELVSDLEQGDFRILEDGVEQRIVLFAADPVPISAVVLIDNALNSKNSEEVQKSLRAITGGMGPGDETAVFRFDHDSEQISDFISDSDALMTQLARVQLTGDYVAPAGEPMNSGVDTAGPAPGAPSVSLKRSTGVSEKCINDALYAAAELLRTRPRDRRKVIYLISDGVDSKQNIYNFKDTVKVLISSETAVYGIGIGEAFFKRGINVVAKFSHATGGDIFYPRGPRDLEALYSRIAEQARNQYTIGYAPQHNDRTVTYHSIEVRIERPGLRLLSRDGYYSAPHP
jgi:VWFA-related protein